MNLHPSQDLMNQAYKVYLLLFHISLCHHTNHYLREEMKEDHSIIFFIKDMMRFLNWTRAAILYEDEFGLVRLQDLVRTPPMKNLELYIRQTNPANYR